MIKQPEYIPLTLQEMNNLGWKQPDVIIITGDAYVDHPGFGAAIIGRYLISYGFRVAIISQPDWKDEADFLRFGEPELFWGITSGNMDSMINHYTAQKKIRSNDAYTPNDLTGKRPNRATMIYSQMVKKISEKPIVLGGIEASMRRIPHYDFWSDKIRNSILFDSRADILVYGMAELTILEIAQSLQKEKEIPVNIRGTVVSVKSSEDAESIMMPELQELENREKFLKFSRIFNENYQTKTLFQRFSFRYLKHNPPQRPLTTKEIDEVYLLPFAKKPHPIYKEKKITAYEQIRNSIVSHRGCFGGCNFCAIGLHQGKTIQSSSFSSIRAEIASLTKDKEFTGN
ncbi:MAG: YgiQ family radical SAM protein, partial [Candidatus Cloacimonetes bacterium]|nr:YgiQ family radical SAM protein [Candidatus Cloacimonadota bacterium]